MERHLTSITGQNINQTTSRTKIVSTPLGHFVIISTNGMTSIVRTVTRSLARKVLLKYLKPLSYCSIKGYSDFTLDSNNRQERLLHIDSNTELPVRPDSIHRVTLNGELADQRGVINNYTVCYSIDSLNTTDKHTLTD